VFCGSVELYSAEWSRSFPQILRLPLPLLLDRHIRRDIVEALSDTRVVVVLGARQVGKSTLVEQIAAHDHAARVLTFDDRATREAAAEDPTGFVVGIATPVVLDEVQRVPDVLLAIKQRVDRDQAPGQFLLTGSANILTAPRIADALTGRAEYYRLAPFSQGELAGHRESFIPDLFAGRFPNIGDAPVGRGSYAERITAGGYPEALQRSSRRRLRFFESYVESLMQRDLTDIGRVHDQANVRRLLEGFAAISGSLVNFDGLSRELGLSANTVRSHADLLQTLFLVARVPSWHSNLLSRVIKAPKAHVTDTGLLCALAGIDERRIDVDGSAAGLAFETFAVMELLRQSTWQAEPVRVFHYRDKEKREVDALLERRDGTVVAIEVKAAASVGSADFRTLRHLRERLGSRFRAGALLYAGEQTVPFGERLAAVPLSGLWT
jgi:predicted AAA+ superfamily ATPase